MSKKRHKNIANDDSNSLVEPIIYLSVDAPKQIPEIVSEIISMRGIVKLSIVNWSGKVLYNYERWGKIEKSFSENDTLDLLKLIKKQLEKIGKKTIDHLILKSEDVNIVVFSSSEIVIFLHCDRKAILPLITIKTKRIIQNLTSNI
ncbi:MAG TPA: hypothetical protein VMZ29_17475 [Candidatus Bathyarchaeia archaeon]|nr:hypothetical protein [Candidatus Bathyarchaeia archaeon]